MNTFSNIENASFIANIHVNKSPPANSTVGPLKFSQIT